MKKPNKNRVLIVEDEAELREGLSHALARAHYIVEQAADGKEAIEKLQADYFDIMIIDMRMPVGNTIDPRAGLRVLELAGKMDPEMIVMVMTAYGDIDNVVESMRLGAADYVTKPFSADDMKLRIERALQQRDLVQENVKLSSEVKNLQEQLAGKSSFYSIIGTSKAMEKVIERIKAVADVRTNIMIYGESGTGKELVARAIHYSGSLKDQPFVPVNCAAIPETLVESTLFGHEKGAFTGAVSAREGMFEHANGGTIFFDEIGDMPLPTQAKLLRTLQERTFCRVGGADTISVDVRVIAATHRNIGEMIREGQFREDLYFRLNVIDIKLPTLRERKEDIPELVGHFIKKYRKKHNKEVTGIDAEAMKILEQHDWRRNNIRELENTVEKAVILSSGTVLSTADIYLSEDDCSPRDAFSRALDMIVTSGTYSQKDPLLEKVKRALVQKAVEHFGEKQKAAELLGISKPTLYEYLKKE